MLVGGRWKTSDDSGDAKVVSRGDAGLAHENDRKYQNRNVTHGFHMVRGKMGHWMEDFIVADNRKVSGYYLGLYAIFDGHSGCDVAKYLQSHLFENILSQVVYNIHIRSVSNLGRMDTWITVSQHHLMCLNSRTLKYPYTTRGILI